MRFFFGRNVIRKKALNYSSKLTTVLGMKAAFGPYFKIKHFLSNEP